MIPGFGLLPEEFPDAYLRIFDLSDGDVAYFREDIAIPLEPYFGTMGVCPAGAHDQSILPPGTLRRQHGHPPDRARLARSTCRSRSTTRCSRAATRTPRRATARSACTAIEAPMYAALRFTLDEGRSIPAPQFSTPAPLTRARRLGAVLRHDRRQRATSTSRRRTPSGP